MLSYISLVETPSDKGGKHFFSLKKCRILKNFLVKVRHPWGLQGAAKFTKCGTPGGFRVPQNFRKCGTPGGFRVRHTWCGTRGWPFRKH